MSYWAQQRLLKRCLHGDPDALATFATMSYLNQVFKTAAETNLELNQPLSREEEHDVSLAIVGEIYERHSSLPTLRGDLHAQIRLYTYQRVMDAIECHV